MAVKALKPVRTGGTTGVITQKCAAITAFGAYVARVGNGTAKGAPTEDTEDGIGFALEDTVTHTYDGFYDQYDVMPVATGGIVNALVATVADTNIVAGDFLEVIDVSSGSQTNPCGVLAEAGTNAGETKTLTSVAQALEDVTLGSSSYTQTFTSISVGDTAITGITHATMGLSIGDYILLRDADGNCQVNRVASLPDATTVGLLIPATVACTGGGFTDYVHAIKQIKVRIL